MYTRTLARNERSCRSKRRNKNNFFLFQRSWKPKKKKKKRENPFELSHVTSVAISVIQLCNSHRFHFLTRRSYAFVSSNEDIFFLGKYTVTFAFIAERGGCRGSWGIVEQRRGIVPNREISVSISPCGYISWKRACINEW